MNAGIPFIDADEIRERTPWASLIGAIETEFVSGCAPPDRQQYEINQPDGSPVTLLLMPAWGSDGRIGVKLVTVAKENAQRNLPSIHGLYILISAETGIPEAILDAGMLTARRTAAASALACDRLARKGAETLLIVGTGRLARNLSQSHLAVRQLSRIIVWGRSEGKARRLSDELEQNLDVRCEATANLESATAQADIISTATFSIEPLILERWVRPGTHLDLVGAFTPAMRETDSDLIRRADKVFVDTLEGALTEAGDLIQANQDNKFDFQNIAGDLHKIASSTQPLRDNDSEVTLYKSVGSALQDLAAARLCFPTNA